MDALRLKIDLSGLADKLTEKLSALASPESLMRPIAFDVAALMTIRIHDEGKDSTNAPIGTYSSGYMKVRQTKYKRLGGTKVIASLTTELENDWAVIATGKNGYGVGFKNPHNADKAGWVEGTYKKDIFKLSASEREYVRDRFQDLVKAMLSDNPPKVTERRAGWELIRDRKS